MQITDSYLVLRESTFTNTITQVLRGYVRLLGTNTFDGQPFQILRETFQAIQPLVVDGIHASNVTTAGGVSLTGGSFVLGSKNVLQGNLYPVDVEAGLALVGCPSHRNGIHASNVHNRGRCQP